MIARKTLAGITTRIKARFAENLAWVTSGVKSVRNAIEVRM